MCTSNLNWSSDQTIAQMKLGDCYCPILHLVILLRVLNVFIGGKLSVSSSRIDLCQISCLFDKDILHFYNSFYAVKFALNSVNIKKIFVLTFDLQSFHKYMLYWPSSSLRNTHSNLYYLY